MIWLLMFGDISASFALEWRLPSSELTSEEAAAVLDNQLPYAHPPNSMLDIMLY